METAGWSGWSLYLPNNQLKWSQGYDSSPIWPSEPELSTIREIISSCIAESNFILEFLADGAHHRIFEVAIPPQSASYLFRVAVSVDPTLKMESEMATLEFLRRHTSIPVPKPLFWDSSADNKLGYEWCLVKRLPGVELREVWRKMPWASKLALVDDMAEYLCQLWHQDLKFPLTGSLYFASAEPKHPEAPDSMSRRTTCAEILAADGFRVGSSIDSAFFAGRHRYLPSQRGPYESCHDWLNALIKIEETFSSTARQMLELRSEMPDRLKGENHEGMVSEEIGYDDDSSCSVHEHQTDTCEAYLRLLPEIFPDSESVGGEARFSLFHCDLREANILVDPETFKITGVIDWEQTCTVPSWYGLDYPMFINKDEPFDDDEPRIPDTYDSDDQDYNGARVANRDRRDAKQLRNRFDTKMEKLGWKDWKPNSCFDQAKSAFIQGVGDLNDYWERAHSGLERIDELLDRNGPSPVEDDETDEADEEDPNNAETAQEKRGTDHKLPGLEK